MKPLEKDMRFLAVHGVLNIYSAIGKSDFQVFQKIINLTDEQLLMVWNDIEVIIKNTR